MNLISAGGGHAAAMGRTKANMNPPAAVPQITGTATFGLEQKLKMGGGFDRAAGRAWNLSRSSGLAGYA
jgi:hypothetical protein